jgi:hypothetical protein
MPAAAQPSGLLDVEALTIGIVVVLLVLDVAVVATQCRHRLLIQYTIQHAVKPVIGPRPPTDGCMNC